MCLACCTNGALPPARSRRMNGVVHESRAQRARLTSQAPQAHVEEDTNADADSIEPNIPIANVPMRVACRRRPRLLARDRDEHCPRKTRSRRVVTK